MIQRLQNRWRSSREHRIDREAAKGGAITLSALRKCLDEAELIYNGPDKDSYRAQIDSHLEYLSAKYGDSIPVDQAYALMKRLE